MSVILPQNSKIKPAIWMCDPGIVAYNCARMGLPMPVLAMPFWEGAGNKIFDYSGNQNHGIFVNAPIWVGNNVDLEYSSSQYIICGNNDSIKLNDTSFTIVARVNLESSQAVCPIVNMGGGGTGGKRFGLHYMGLNYYAEVDDNSTKTTLAITSVYPVVGEWNTVCFVRDYQQTLRIYVNGVDAGSTGDSSGDLGDLNDLPFLIGGYEYSLGGGVTKYWDGLIDFVYVFNQVLTGAQIQTFQNNRYGMFEPIRSPAIWSIPLAPTTAAPTTTAPTTLPPTTLAPTTLAPTTLAPTTLAPTTLAPTTLAPTTLAPTTAAPTTLPPTTIPPTTAAPADIRSAQVLAQVEWQEPGLIKAAQVVAQVEWVEDISTTAAPTTLAPTTLAPTSLPPTTLAPTTLAPTTLAPTTLAPTSLAPTTIAPTTLPPTTLQPTTLAPTTLAPTSLAPTTLAPTTPYQTTAVPTTLAPTTLKPTTIPPTTLQPTTLPPTTLAPTTVGPTTIAPTTVPPTTGLPEEICVKDLRSVISKELFLRSVITKEIGFHGYLC